MPMPFAVAARTFIPVPWWRRRCSDGGFGRRRRIVTGGRLNLLHLRPSTTIAAARGLAVLASARVVVLVVVLLRRLLRLRLRRLLLRVTPRHLLARLVAHRDEQRGHVLAVLAGLLERGAGAVGSDAFTTEANGHLVGIGIGAAHATVSRGIVEVNLIDDLAFLVVETAEERSGSEQASKSAVGQRGEGVG